MEQKFLDFIADVMGVDVSDIGMETVYKDYEKWDSLMMLTLVMETEGEYGISIPMEKLNDIHSLKDLYQMIDK